MEEKPEGHLFHIGADTTGKETVGISSPRIGNTYELLPIVEIDERSRQEENYGELYCRNTDQSEKISRYLPKNFDLKLTPHLDPDLDNVTYGEPATYKTRKGKIVTNGKAEALRALKRGRDYVFFAASIARSPGCPNQYSRSSILEYQKPDRSKYIIGYFRIKGIFEGHVHHGKVEELSPLGNSDRDACYEQLKENAHCRRYSEHFVCVVGFRRPEGLLIETPVGITDRGSCKLNSLGLDLLKREYPDARAYYRGARHLDSHAMERLRKELKISG